MFDYITKKDYEQLRSMGLAIVKPTKGAASDIPVLCVLPALQNAVDREDLDKDLAELAAMCDNFAKEMFNKMVKAQAHVCGNDFIKNPNNADSLRLQLYDHIDKGDPIDVANYCMFLHYLSEKTSSDKSNPISAIKKRVMEAVEREFNIFEKAKPMFATGQNMESCKDQIIPERFRETAGQLELPL